MEYYKVGGIEAIDYIKAKHEEFKEGLKSNIIKYITIAGKEGNASELEDFEHAQWFLNKLIAFVKEDQKQPEISKNIDDDAVLLPFFAALRSIREGEV